MKDVFFNDRVLGLIIDFVIISIITTLLSSFCGFEFDEIGDFSFLNRKWIVVYSSNFFIMLIYFVVFDFLKNGITIGKSILNLKVLKESNLSTSISDRLKRTLLKTLSLSTFFLVPIIFIYYLLKNEIIYDKFMNTKTVKY